MSGHLDGPPPGPPDPPYIPGDLGAPSAKEFARRRAGDRHMNDNPYPNASDTMHYELHTAWDEGYAEGFAAGRAAATPDQPKTGATSREQREAAIKKATAMVDADTTGLLRPAVAPAASPDPPREEWRVVDGDNVVCRLAGHRDFGTFRPWAEEQCRRLVERFPGESFRIERRVGDEEWEAWCPPDTPMGSCIPRCGDARCEAAASPDERLREAGERLAQAVARVCGEGHPALGMWRVALAAADREENTDG